MLEIDIYKYNLEDSTYIDDWTSISDIGQKFHGQLLTYQSYLQEEDRYVNTIQELLQFLHIQNLTVDWCSKFFSLRYHQKHGRLTSVQSQLYQKLDKGLIVNRNEIADIIRLNLRESIDCSLSNSIITIYFDYDYYMSIKIADKSDLHHIINIIKKHGLFWRPSKNHYYPEDKDNKVAFGFTWNNGLINPPGDYHHDLRISKDDPLNRTYTEWSHFDEIENGLDWAEYQTVEQKYLQLVLDFLDKFQVSEFAINSLSLNNIQELGVSEQYFSPQEKVLFQQMYKYEETVEDWTIEPFIVRKEDFSTLFKLMFKRVFTSWITDGSISIQFDASFRLYLSFYGHKKEVQELVEKHGLYWQERQPPYHEAVDFT
ncbi:MULTISPECIES: hypothetical protein [unclassified Streptococcus]|uniref:hypothetical protein n=1 Tax=unclassified Streptococcus TaxID=2608887 RepID=UPI0018A97ABC|nr:MULTISPECIES: hypothetical protein [unclassified Streptococcus]MBF8971123.1 hypothetical protein [Streptococcus sp. NLN76]MBG9367899.1 hypothetical protein [Streptococcus sp. NLN64]MBJ6746392.1 hypothetical protein [Streptococcus sp. 121]